MTADRVLVALAGAGLVAWINWYFFVAGRLEGTGSPRDRTAITDDEARRGSGAA